MCVLASACISSDVDPAQTTTVPADPCGLAPANFTDVPEAVPGQSELQRELNVENLREWQDQLLVPLDEAVAMLAPLLVDADVIEDPIEAWDVLWVMVSLDPPIPLRILDEVLPLFPEEVGFSGYAELDDGYPMQLSGSTPEELSDRFDGLLLSLTTTTVVSGRSGTTAAADVVELAGLAAGARDLRLVVPAYAIPTSLLRGIGYEALPLRDLVTGVQIGSSRTATGWAKTSDELFTASAGWRFCQEVAEALEP